MQVREYVGLAAHTRQTSIAATHRRDEPRAREEGPGVDHAERTGSERSAFTARAPAGAPLGRPPSSLPPPAPLGGRHSAAVTGGEPAQPVDSGAYRRSSESVSVARSSPPTLTRALCVSACRRESSATQRPLAPRARLLRRRADRRSHAGQLRREPQHHGRAAYAPARTSSSARAKCRPGAGPRPTEDLCSAHRILTSAGNGLRPAPHGKYRSSRPPLTTASILG